MSKADTLYEYPTGGRLMLARKRYDKRIRSAAPVHTYVGGQPYSPPRVRHAQRDDIEQMQPLTHSVTSGRPTTKRFLYEIERELKIRFYTHNSVRNYISQLRSFLRWFGNEPHKVTREDVRCYLELLVDGGASSSQLSGCLSAIRTGFDKMCLRDVTLGLVTPRRPKRQPVILSPTEVTRILAAAPTVTCKLAIGIMYAAGLRNSELCCLRISDVDFDRKTIRVHQGKGNSDRLVMLPQTFREQLRFLCRDQPAHGFLFPSQQTRKNRHMSPRTLQRWVKLATEMAGVVKHVTPHSFRHAFATHLFENGTDIRFIQKLLGHQRLETTTIYTHVAKISTQAITSPIDQLQQTHQCQVENEVPTSGIEKRETAPDRLHQPTDASNVGRLKFHFLDAVASRSAKVTIEICGIANLPRQFLTGIEVAHTDSHWLKLTVPTASDWQQTLNQLPATVRKRIERPEFYELIRSEISSRFLHRSADW